MLHVISLFLKFTADMLPRVPDVFSSVSWEGKKKSGNGGQLTDCAAPIGFK